MRREAGYGNVAFAVAGDDSLPADAPFDAAIGRLVLIHQRDPATMIRRAAAVVRPGGVVAFLEPALHLDGHSLPEVELVRAATGSFRRLMLAALPSPDVAGRMIPCFMAAGLPEPKVLWESVVPGSKDDVWLRSFVLTYKTFLPLMQKFGTVDPRVGDPETLAERITAEAVAKRAQGVTGPIRQRLGDQGVERVAVLATPPALARPPLTPALSQRERGRYIPPSDPFSPREKVARRAG